MLKAIASTVEMLDVRAATARSAGFACALAAALVAGASAAMASDNTAPGASPHRAIYDISLARTTAGANVTELTGRMVYELKGSQCAGYAQTMRFVTRSVDNSGGRTLSDMRSSFKEDAASRKFSFESENYRDERRAERTVGTAERSNAGGGDINLKITMPRAKSKSFSGDVLFPVAHSIALLKAAQSGERIFSSKVFDGSEQGEKVFTTTAALGPKLEPGHNAALTPKGDFASLDTVPAWPVSLSYFEADNGKRGDNVPSYELSFLFFENGVSRKLLIDYGAFAIRGTMSKLEMLEATPCS